MKKKLLAMLLSLSMAMQMTVFAGAGDETEDTAAASEEPQAIECEICGEYDCETEHVQCEICGEYDCETEHVQCEICGEYDCEIEHIQCEICGEYDCETEHVQCEFCGEYDCETEHVQCEICGEYDCEIEHIQCEICGEYDCETEHVQCEICGEYDCETEHVQCEVCKEYDCEAEHPECKACGTVDCTAEHVYCDTCQKYDCGVTHVTCDICGAVDCTTEHVYCEPCEKYDCGIEHVICSECMVDGGHDSTCSQYVCTECGVMGGHAHNCVTNCDCGTEDDVHSDTCIVYCECDYLDEQHAIECPLYVSFFDDLLVCETLDAMYVLAYAPENEEALFALAEEEITMLNARVEEIYAACLDPDNSYVEIIGEDGSTFWSETELYQELLATFAWLPNAPIEEGVEADAVTYDVSYENDKYIVNTVAENIQMNLFNYGPGINTQDNGQGFLKFVHGENYGSAVDGYGEGNAGGWPMLNTSLSQNSPYPYVSSSNEVLKVGSLQYLFDPKYSKRTSGEQYNSAYFPIENSDGKGTGLFKQEDNYFVYDSGKNAAWYNTNTKKFELYDYTVIPNYTTYTTDATNGNFLPFNQGHTQGTSVSEGAAYKLNDGEVDLWFGLTMEFDFYQPLNGQKSGEAMEFEFIGDDDVFIYIDDVLILDIGGTHGAQTGKINFATGEVTNPTGFGQYGTDGKSTSTLYELMKAALRDNLNEDEFIDSDGDEKKDTFKDYTRHNLKFYYLERGGNISYCKLKFNMDPLPNGAVSVKKEEANLNEQFMNKTSYEFTIDVKNSEDESVTEADKIYQIEGPLELEVDERNIVSSNDNGIQTYKISEKGKFYLKNGQTAVFSNIQVNDTFSITESSDEKYTTTYTVNGGTSGESAEQLTINSPDDKYEILVTNTWDTKDIIIEKILEDNAVDAHPDEKEFEFTLNFFEDESKSYGYSGIGKKNDETTGVDIKQGKFNLKANEFITILDIPVGTTYSIEETLLESTDSKYGYEAPVYKHNLGGEYDGIDNKNITLTAGTNHVYVINEYNRLVADLIITKILNLTEDDYVDAHQSFIFNVFSDDLNMNVVINADQILEDSSSQYSVTIKDLPLDTYTVTEAGDWSTRYTTVSIEDTDKSTAEGTITLSAAGVNEVTVTNTRGDDQWLDGNTQCTNLFSKNIEDKAKHYKTTKIKGGE